MKDRFDLIIFDWDGTLVDSVDWIVHCLQTTAADFSCLVPEKQEVKNIIGLSIHKALDKLFPDLDQAGREVFLAGYSKTFFSRQMSRQDLFAGVQEMLQQFRRDGYRLAVATGKSRNGLDKAMQGTGLEGFFDSTQCADETASKPSPDMLENILKETAVDKQRAVMVGDSTHDMQMAVNAGMASIAVLCGANSQQQLEVYQPLLNLPQTSDLLAVL